jgi:hypothetical protein
MTSTIVEITDPLAGRKRPQAIALPGQHAKRATKKINKSVNAGALVPFMAPPYCIDAVPLAAVAPGRAEPSWIRARLLRELGFRADMEVRFIAQKVVTNTDLDTQQSRFRIPNDGVQHRLRGMLSDAELEAANLLHLKAPWPRPRKQPPAMMIQARQGEQGGKRTRQKGRDHVGLPMVLVDARGRTKEMKLTQWDSSRSTVIHGDGYLEFMRQCGYEPEDVVEIWAFREKPFRLFGVNMCAESPLHVVIAYKEKQFAT